MGFESKCALAESIKRVSNVTRVLASKDSSNISNVMELERFGSYQKCVHASAWVYRFINNLRASLANKKYQQGNEKSKEEVDNAKIFLYVRYKRNHLLRKSNICRLKGKQSPFHMLHNFISV